MRDYRKKEIRRSSTAFREKCKVSRYGIIDLFKECERAGYKLFRYPIGVHSDLGFTVKIDEDIVIFTNTSSRMSRELFTLAHEIGHIILHMGVDNSFIDDDATMEGADIGEKEKEANYFAACLLMPEDEVDRFFDLEFMNSKQEDLSATDIARIMSEFNVSFDMALNRLEDLKKINAGQKIRLDNEKVEKRVGNLLRSVGGNAKLNISSNEIAIPHEYMDYVIYNYNHNAVPKETLEAVLECYNLSIEDVSDRIVEHKTNDDDILDDLIGGLND